MINKDKIILDLCGGTGAWSKPYKDNEYDVRNITLPEYDVRTYIPPENVYGILAAPPCTMFSLARTNAKIPRDLKVGMEIVIACLNIIWKYQYILDTDTAHKTILKFWALENPFYGFIQFFLGKPAFIFDPCEFGDGYKKRTALWGNFKEPSKQGFLLSYESMIACKTNSRALPTMGGHDKFNKNTAWKRAITPPGFARAFYEANK